MFQKIRRSAYRLQSPDEQPSVSKRAWLAWFTTRGYVPRPVIDGRRKNEMRLKVLVALAGVGPGRPRPQPFLSRATTLLAEMVAQTANPKEGA